MAKEEDRGYGLGLYSLLGPFAREFRLVREGKEGMDCRINFRPILVDDGGLKSPCGGGRVTLLLLGETFLTLVLEVQPLQRVSGITSSQGVFSNLGSV